MFQLFYRLCGPFAVLRDESGIDESVQLSAQHGEHVPLLLSCPVVLDHLVGRQHVGADLVAERVVPQAGRVLVALGLPLLLFSLENLTLPKHSKYRQQFSPICRDVTITNKGRKRRVHATFPLGLYQGGANAV